MESRTYKIEQETGRWGKLPRYVVTVGDDEVGTIEAMFKSLESNRAYGYQTHVALEFDALTDDGGYPNEYRTIKDAKQAVDDLMRRNGIYNEGQINEEI